MLKGERRPWKPLWSQAARLGPAQRQHVWCTYQVPVVGLAVALLWYFAGRVWVDVELGPATELQGAMYLVPAFPPPLIAPRRTLGVSRIYSSDRLTPVTHSDSVRATA